MESKEKRIKLEEEDPALFGFFARYLYTDSPLLDKDEIKHDTEYVVLARLYALGDRLQAQRFQAAVLKRFVQSFPDSPEFETSFLPVLQVCELLDIVLSELPDKKEEDRLKMFVPWHAEHRKSMLKEHPYFRRLVREHNHLPSLLSLHTKDKFRSQPEKPREEPEQRFVDEDVYEV